MSKKMSLFPIQWVGKGEGLRRRGYKPIQVKVRPMLTSSPWDKKHDVIAEIDVSKLHNSEYQTLHLTQRDVNQIVESIIDGCDEKTRKEIVLRILKPLNNSDWFKILASGINQRSKS